MTDNIDKIVQEAECAPVAGEAQPVAWRYRAHGGPWELFDECPFDGGTPGPNEQCEPLYAAPRASEKENE